MGAKSEYKLSSQNPLDEKECAVTEMLLAVLSVCSQEELEEDSISSVSDDETRAKADPDRPTLYERRQQIKNKILAVGKMQRVFQILRYGFSSHHRDKAVSQVQTT